MRRVMVVSLALAVVGGLGVSVGIGSYLGMRTMQRREARFMAARTSTGGTGGGGVIVYLTDTHGLRTAQVDITTLPAGGERITVFATGLAPGRHPIHVHAGGTCDPAGTQVFDPHGKGAQFPDLFAGPDGQALEQFTDTDFTIGDLMGPAGTEIVIHAVGGTAENPGARVACGVVSPAR
jgi:Cu/Zn superoxide dismutase